MPYEAAVRGQRCRVGRQFVRGLLGRGGPGCSSGQRELAQAGWRVQGEEPCLRAVDDERMRELAGENRGGARACLDRLVADFDPQLAVQDE